MESDKLCVVSLIPGRVRLRLCGWTSDDARQIETRLSQVKGVKRVRANRRTGNALIHFDESLTDGQRLLAALQADWTELLARGMPPTPPHEHAKPGCFLLRLGVRGLLGHAVVDSAWFGAGYLGSALGVPFLAALGPVHILMDVAIWGIAWRSAARRDPPPAAARTTISSHNQIQRIRWNRASN